MINTHTEFEVSSLSRSKDILRGLKVLSTYDTFVNETVKDGADRGNE